MHVSDTENRSAFMVAILWAWVRMSISMTETHGGAHCHYKTASIADPFEVISNSLLNIPIGTSNSVYWKPHYFRPHPSFYFILYFPSPWVIISTQLLEENSRWLSWTPSPHTPKSSTTDSVPHPNHLLNLSISLWSFRLSAVVHSDYAVTSNLLQSYFLIIFPAIISKIFGSSNLIMSLFLKYFSTSPVYWW